jgi:hypothetical protein
LFRSHDSEEQSLAPHRYRKPLRGGRLHSGVYDPDIEGANNRSNRQRSKGPLRGRQLALHHSGRPVEVSASPIIIYPTLIPGPRIDASLLLPASMKSPILIDIDVMQAFIPWEFRVAGVFER